MSKVKMIGIGDAHGIDNFTEMGDGNSDFCITIRAQSNRQRHAVAFTANMEESTRDKVLEMCKKGENKSALSFIKSDPDIELAIEKGWEKSWEMIPNSKLDPWSR